MTTSVPAPGRCSDFGPHPSTLPSPVSKKPKRQLPEFLHQPLYYAVRGALATMLTGELEANLRTARALGRAWARFEKKRVVRAMDNIAVAFPDMPADERHAHAIEAYEHLFMLAVETAYTPRLMNHDGWSERIRVGNLNQAVRALSSGRPCVMLTGHCGNWELLGYTLALIGFPVHALYRPLDLKPLDQWVRRTRERRGLTLVDKFGATETVPRIMNNGGLLGFIADQNAGDRGLFVPFFGRLASTYKTIGLLAIQHNAPILCGQARRLVWSRDGDAESDEDALTGARSLGFASWGGEPFKYRIDIGDIIMPEDWKDQPDPLFYVTARYRRAIEQMVRIAPEQNLWLHRYWKSRPRFERLGRPFPDSLRNKLRALPWMTDAEMSRIEEWSRRDTAEPETRALSASSAG